MSQDLSKQIKEQWNDIKNTFRKESEISDISYKTWVEPLSFYRFSNNVVEIIVPGNEAFQLQYISNKFKNFFQVIISECLNTTVEINFILEGDLKAQANDKEPEPSKPVYNIAALNANLNPKYKFDSFVVGSNNKFAHSASLAVAETPGGAYNPLYLYGGPGLGKTHLMHSVGHFILEQDPNKKVLYVTSEDFTNEVIESIRSGNQSAMSKFRDKYRTVDVLMVDDVQFIIGKESTQEEFFHTFNALYGAGKQIILSSDKPPKEMETLEERFRSRFEMGLIADIQAPDYETRMAILRKYTENYDKPIDDEIIQYIATNIKSNIRELEGAFNQVIAMARLNKEDLTLNLAQDALKNIINPQQSRQITPELILNTVAEHFNIAPDDITSKKRTAECVEARHVVMYLCRTMTDASLDNIAKMIGKNDHTTVMHGVEKIEKKLVENEELKKKVQLIKTILSPV